MPAPYSTPKINILKIFILRRTKPRRILGRVSLPQLLLITPLTALRRSPGDQLSLGIQCCLNTRRPLDAGGLRAITFPHFI